MESLLRSLGLRVFIALACLLAGWLLLGTNVTQAQRVPPSLTVNNVPAEGGTVQIDGEMVRYEDTYYFRSGDTATIVAHPTDGWRFVRWSGELTGTAQRETIVIDRKKNITAHWERILRPESSSTSLDNTRFTQVSTGRKSVCAVSRDGRLQCWYDGSDNNDNVPGGLFREVSVGGFSCAVRVSGETVCWGGGPSSQPPNRHYVTVDVGTVHACGLTSTGRVECWGDDGWEGELSRPEGLLEVPNSRFIQIDVSGQYSCGVTVTGEVECWGDWRYDRFQPPGGRFIQVDVEITHVAAIFCGLRLSGAVECWGTDADPILPLVRGSGGNNTFGMLEAPETAFSQVSLSPRHACGVTQSGGLECWGRSDENQASPPSGTFTQVDSNRSYSCAIRESGALECWGDKPSGVEWAVPTRSAIAVSTGGTGSCALTTSGGLVCWPLNDSVDNLYPWDWPWRLTGDRFTQISMTTIDGCGVRASGSIECWAKAQLSPLTPPPGSFVQVTVNNIGACGVTTTGSIDCWSRDEQRFDVSNRLTGTFVQFELLPYRTACGLRVNGMIECTRERGDVASFSPSRGVFVTMSAGGSTVCGLTNHGTIECANTWGSGTTLEPDEQPDGLFSDVSVGYYFACAVRSDSAIVCWDGHDERTYVGDKHRYVAVDLASEMHSNEFCAVRTNGSVHCGSWNSPRDPPDGRFTQLSADDFTHCGVATDSSIECWGLRWVYENPGGYPFRAPSLAGQFSQVSAGSASTCGLGTDGAIACGGADTLDGPYVDMSSQNEKWCGLLESGQVQCGSNGDVYLNTGQGVRSLPSPSGGFVQLQVEHNYACGIRVGGNIDCWSLTDLDRTWAENARKTRTVLREVPTGRFRDLTTAEYYACAIAVHGTVKCWGTVDFGQDQVPNGSFLHVSAGATHACGLRSGGTILCWGSNSHGQLEVVPGEYSDVSAGWGHTCAIRQDGTVECWGLFNHYEDLEKLGLAVGRHEATPIRVAEGRIVARRVADGRTEFAFQPEGEERILPRSRYFPASARVERWLQSSPISVDGRDIGRISARLLA